MDPHRVEDMGVKTISGSLEANFGEKQVHLGTFTSTKDKVCWQVNKTVIHWGGFCGSKIRTMGDCSQCLVRVRVCETPSSKQGEVPSIEMPRRSMDADERGTARFNVEILVRDAPCQDIAGDSRGSPTRSTQLICRSGGL